MAELPTNEFVDARNGQYYYVAGTRIPLEVLVYALRRGETAETVLEKYPSMGSLKRVNGAVAFVESHPEAVEEYMRAIAALWEKVKREHPIPDELRLRWDRARKDLARRSA
jgi:uncharacterized protein (DUF433 family)